MMILNVFKVFGLAAFTFFLAFFLTPFFTHYLYKYKLWKKSSRSDATNPVTDEFRKIHNHGEEASTPRIGGVLIWGSVVLVSGLVWIVSKLFPAELALKINFLSQNQTWLPLAVLIVASIIGLVDDFFQIFSSRKGDFSPEGLPRRIRILSVLIIGVLCGLWFFLKLDMNSINIPFWGEIGLGWLFVPFFPWQCLSFFQVE